MSPVSSPQKYLRMEPSPFGEVSSRLTTGTSLNPHFLFKGSLKFSMVKSLLIVNWTAFTPLAFPQCVPVFVCG